MAPSTFIGREFPAAVLLTLMASTAIARQGEPEAACTEPFRTAELIRVVIARWDEWTVDSLRTFWPDPIEALDIGNTEGELPTMYGRYIGEYGRCGEVFFFTRAARGNPQFLDQVEFRYASSELDDVELAGKAILRAYGRPFEFLGEAYDEWRLDDDGLLRRDYTWTEPETRVSIEIEQRDALFRLSMTYDRETRLDRAPPETPETPLKLAVALPDPDTFAPHLSICIRGEPTAEEACVGSRLLRLLEHELAARAHWFEIVAVEEADFTVLVGAHWEDTTRCISADVSLPGQSLGVAFTERGPGWRDLETLEEGARELAGSIEERFREHYWRIRQLHSQPRDRAR